VAANDGQSGALCPSARCEPGAILLGIVRSDGRIAYVGNGLRVDEDFVAAATSGRAPEKRFRFAQPCVETGCAHWEESRCGVVDAAVEMAPTGAQSAEVALPRCGIRGECRWFAQWGATACAVCPLVVTNVSDAISYMRDDSSAPGPNSEENLSCQGK
jgi:hypothetical protein